MSFRPTLEDRPWSLLTRHFFLGLFDFGGLSESGSDAFRRLLTGIVAVILTCGLLLVRIFMGKYAALSEIFTRRGPYLIAVLGDDALVIGLPMLVVAFATLLVSHALFPDETDFRVLLPLPISRAVVFLSKLLALVLFTGLFIAAAHAAMTPLVVTMSISRWSDHGVVRRLIAYECASIGASVFVLLALTALNGLLLMCVPRARLQAVSLWFRSAMLCVLVLSIPLVAKLPTIGPLAASESPLLYFVPPVWFLGAERLLLGSATPYFVRLCSIAVAAFVLALVIAVGSYAFLYSRFDRTILRPADAPTGPRRGLPSVLRRLDDRRPAFAAISLFLRATLARSPLHQGVFVAIAACGAGLVVTRLIGAAGTTGRRSPADALAAAAIWAPFALVFVMSIAIRAALVLPIEPRANWLFRITEDDASRTAQLSAVMHTATWLGVVVPLVALAPIGWALLGPATLQCSSIALLCGLVLVELAMAEWRCIPFTCSYVPGKRFIGQTILLGGTAFVAFTAIGAGLVRYSVAHRIGWLAILGVLAAIVWCMRRQRRFTWRHTTLMFEEVLPNEVDPLRLSSY
jgi:hypothetical protein